MIKFRSIDFPLLILLLSNAWCIWYYMEHPEGFNTLLWIYWWQSLIIGLFNVIYLAGLQNMVPGTLKINDEPVTTKSNGCMAAFFTVHYGAFHLAYAIFLLVKYASHVDGRLVLYTALAFLLQSFLTHREKKEYEKTHAIDAGVLFFLPYLRIVPMHLMLLLPAFLGGSPSMIFLLLKTAADIGFYFISGRLFARKAVKLDEAYESAN